MSLPFGGEHLAPHISANNYRLSEDIKLSVLYSPSREAFQVPASPPEYGAGHEVTKRFSSLIRKTLF